MAHKAVKGTIWSAFDRFGVLILQFIVNLILARLLTPSDFGAIGMLTIFITVSQVFVDSGFGSALIQKKHPSETDYSTIFIWNLSIGIVLYILLFLSSPLIADFYNLPILSKILRAIGVTLIFSCITSIQVNRLQKRLQFKTIAITDILTYIIAGSIGVWLAYSGYEVWSLVWMMIFQGFGRVIMLYLVSHWLPDFSFSVKSFKSLFSFGGFLFAANILETICKNLQGIIIGKVFSASQMGYYTQAAKLDNITSYSIPQVIASVMYPLFSQVQDDKKKLGDMVCRNLSIISFLIYPILGTLICIAHPLIKLLYGEQWLPAAPYFQILCVGGFFLCLNNITYYAVAACGKSKSLFLSSFFKWGIYGVLLLIGMNFGMYGIISSLSLGIINIFFINSFLARKYVGLRLREIIYSFMPALLIIIGSMSIYWGCNYLMSLPWYLGGVLVISTYILISYLLKLKEISYCRNLIISFINKYKHS